MHLRRSVAYIGSFKYLPHYSQLLAQYVYIGEDRHISWLCIRLQVLIVFTHTLHTLTKKRNLNASQRTHTLGLISLILVVIVAMNGLPALWSFEFGKWSRVHPVYLKLFHNLIGIFAFIIGKWNVGDRKEKSRTSDWCWISYQRRQCVKGKNVETLKFCVFLCRHGQFILWISLHIFCRIRRERH